MICTRCHKRNEEKLGHEENAIFYRGNFKKFKTKLLGEIGLDKYKATRVNSTSCLGHCPPNQIQCIHIKEGTITDLPRVHHNLDTNEWVDYLDNKLTN